MGEVASTYADYVVVTSDNPRNEKPESIINDILDGFKTGFNSYTTIVNREEAIQKALDLVKKDDLLVVAGKGHEDYQIIKNRVTHFDDAEIIREILREMDGS